MTDRSSPIARAQFDIHPDVETRYAAQVLTPRKRRMVTTYARTGSYTEAANASGYGINTVRKYLNEDKLVQKVLGQIVDQAATLAGMSLERLMEEYGRLAFSDIAEYVELFNAESESELNLLVADLPAELSAAISEVSYVKAKYNADGDEISPASVKLKLHDKKSALDSLARMLGLFNDKLDVNVKTDYGDRLARAIERLNEAKAIEAGVIDGTYEEIEKDG